MDIVRPGEQWAFNKALKYDASKTYSESSFELMMQVKDQILYAPKANINFNFEAPSSTGDGHVSYSFTPQASWTLDTVCSIKLIEVSSISSDFGTSWGTVIGTAAFIIKLAPDTVQM